MKYEKWSRGYWLVKNYIRLADWLIHKKTIIKGREKIPRNKPIVFAPNHQNGLSDPMAVLLNTRFQPVWLARADIFGKSKWIDAILRFLKIMPVYRMRDGKANLEKNEETFSNSIKVLENNFSLALFPEAAHSARRQMLVHKKAVPRIVFMAEEKSEQSLDIQIIPTGIYYSHYWKFNRTVIVNFGDPIRVKDYLVQYHENPAAATISLKTKIFEAILPLVIHIKSKKHYADFEKIREIYGPRYLDRQKKSFSEWNLFQSDRQLVQQLDKLEAEKPEETELVVREVNAFDNQILNLKIRNWLVAETPRQLFKLVQNFLLLVLIFPLFLYGFLFNALPFFFIDRTVRKKVKDISFWSTFFLGAGLILFPLFYLLEVLAVASFLPGAVPKILFFISLPFAGKVAFWWTIRFRKNLGRWRWLRLKFFSPKTHNEVLNQKENLYQKLDQLIPL